MVLGYLRDVKGEKGVGVQKSCLLKYAKKHTLTIDRFIEIQPYSKKSAQQKRLELLLYHASAGDTFMVTELSRMGRNILEVLNLLVALKKEGVSVIFTKQPELNTTEENLLLQEMLNVYGYFIEAESTFISRRTKQGLAAVKAKGIKLGRPKGHKNRERALDVHREEIMGLLNLGVNLTAIRKIVNEKMDKPLSYTSYKYFIDHDEGLLHAKHNYDKTSLFH